MHHKITHLELLFKVLLPQKVLKFYDEMQIANTPALQLYIKNDQAAMSSLSEILTSDCSNFMSVCVNQCNQHFVTKKTIEALWIG